jgi:hypothetical protein
MHTNWKVCFLPLQEFDLVLHQNTDAAKINTVSELIVVTRRIISRILPFRSDSDPTAEDGGTGCRIGAGLGASGHCSGRSSRESHAEALMCQIGFRLKHSFVSPRYTSGSKVENWFNTGTGPVKSGLYEMLKRERAVKLMIRAGMDPDKLL